MLEVIDDTQPYTIFDPEHIWKRKTVENFRAVKLREQLFDHGKDVSTYRTVQELQQRCREQVATLWDEVTRFENPHHYYVDLSQNLWEVKNRLLQENAR